MRAARISSLAVSTAASVLLAASAPRVGNADAAPAAPPVRGNLLLIGGGDEPAAYWPKFLELAGGKDAPIVILPTASSRPESGPEYEQDLRETYGATRVRWLPLKSRDDAEREDVATLLGAAKGIFFTGGDQARITAAILGTASERALRAAFAGGAVVGGTSAGTACMSDPMITGNGDFTKIAAGSVELTPGLGLLPSNVIVDQHFITRQRSNRLFTVILEHPDKIGLGVDEKTVLWYKPDGSYEIFGEGLVMKIDARTSTIARDAAAAGSPIAATGVHVDLLAAGTRFRIDAIPPAPAPPK